MELLEYVKENYLNATDAYIADKFKCTKEHVAYVREKNNLKKPFGARYKNTIHNQATTVEMMCAEMKALIALCESTDSLLVKQAAKRRLLKLSEIPKNNEYADRTIAN